jgi:YVTN family beta-propeller protein
MLIEKSDHCLSFYDLASGARLARIALPAFPHEFAVDPDRRYAYVGQYGTHTSADPGPGGAAVLVIDIAHRTLVGTIETEPYRRLHGLAADRRGRLHVLSEAAGALLTFPKPRAGEPPVIVPSGGGRSHLVVVSADGAHAYCSNLESRTVTKIAPADPSVAALVVTPGDRPEGLLLSPDGRLLYVGNRGSNTLAVIDTATMAVVASAPARPDPTRLYWMRDGRLLVANFADCSISVVDSETLAEIAFLPVEGRPAAACIDPLSGHAFVSVDSDQSLEIDLDTMTIVSTIPTGREPDCCVVLAAGDG